MPTDNGNENVDEDHDDKKRGDPKEHQTGDGSSRLDAEAYNSNDAETLGLLCEVSEHIMEMIAERWFGV
jgi:hypothetical protein